MKNDKQGGLNKRNGALSGTSMKDEPEKVRISMKDNSITKNDSVDELKSEPLPPGWIEFYI